MSENKNDQPSSISNARSLEEIGEYWDSHSLSDHWDQTHEVEFQVRAPRRITIDSTVYAQLQNEARQHGMSLEELVKKWLIERLSSNKAA